MTLGNFGIPLLVAALKIFTGQDGARIAFDPQHGKGSPSTTSRNRLTVLWPSAAEGKRGRKNFQRVKAELDVLRGGR